MTFEQRLRETAEVIDSRGFSSPLETVAVLRRTGSYVLAEIKRNGSIWFTVRDDIIGKPCASDLLADDWEHWGTQVEVEYRNPLLFRQFR